MKSARRHELRENDLAQQIEQVLDVVRRHGTAIAVVAAGVVILVSVAVWFINHQASQREESWALLQGGAADAAKTPEVRVNQFRELADKKINSPLTSMALKSAGDAALDAMKQAKDAGDSAAAAKWAEQARSFYQQIIDEYRGEYIPAASAWFGQALLAEERGAFTEAEALYRQIKEDERYRNSPYAAQAQYRLDHLKQWKTPVTFAPASQPSTMPAATNRIPTTRPSGGTAGAPLFPPATQRVLPAP